jgi:ELWxxDGT repeat protein
VFSWSVPTLEERTLLSTVEVGLVKDINQIDASPTDLTELNGELYFLTKDQGASTESLWVSDGTTSGTVELMTSEQFGSSSYGGTTGNLFVPLGGKVYFLADSSSGSSALFATNGTVAGTTEVTSLTDGPGNLTADGADLFFTADYHEQLWVSDGTSAGTMELTSAPTDPSELTAVGDRLFFVAGSDGNSQIWTSDGTDAGTIQVASFSSESYGPEPTVVDGTLYFTGNSGSGEQIWTSDGTVAGTVAVTDFSDTDGDIYSLQNVNGSLYFLANENSSGEQLWTSNGTSAGTVALTNVPDGLSYASDFTVVGGNTFFTATDNSGSSSTDDTDLWEITGGTASIVTTSIPWADGPSDLTTLNNSTLLFWADGGNGDGDELWESDGTAAGTAMVKDINPGSASSYLSNPPSTYGEPTLPTGLSQMLVVDGEAYFGANDGADGDELWESDGTLAGTALVKDIDPGPASSSPQQLTDLNGTLLFVAHDGTGSNQLWQTTGTSASTVVVQSFTPAQTLSSDPANLTGVGDTVFFTADDGFDGTQLWSSDGTANGTTLLTDFTSSSDYSYFDSLLDFNGQLVFIHNDGIDSGALYESNGTAAGTVPIFTSDSSQVSQATVVGNSLYFWTSEYSEGGDSINLWVINGTAAPQELESFTGEPDYSVLGHVGGTFFFEVSDTAVGVTNEEELWTSNGTVAGTVDVTDISADASSYGGYGSSTLGIALGNNLIFTVSDPPHPARAHPASPSGRAMARRVELSSFTTFLPSPPGTDPVPRLAT